MAALLDELGLLELLPTCHKQGMDFGLLWLSEVADLEEVGPGLGRIVALSLFSCQIY